MFGYDTLNNYYKTMFTLVDGHKWDPQWLESLTPWEKALQVELLNQKIKHLEDVRRQQENDYKAQMAQMKRK